MPGGCLHVVAVRETLEEEEEAYREKRFEQCAEGSRANSLYSLRDHTSA